MTQTGRDIEALLTTGWTHWTVSSAEERVIIAKLRADSMPDATLRYLHTRGRIPDLLSRVDARRVELMQAIGGLASPATAATLRPLVLRMARRDYHPSYIAMMGGGPEYIFDLSHDLQTRIRPLGVTSAAAPLTAAVRRARGSGPRGPFSGVGATGRHAPSLDIPLGDQWDLAWGDAAAHQSYGNPLGNLSAYLRGLTPTQRTNQARLLVRRPIVSILPSSYRTRPPSRASVFRAAANTHRLEPELVAAFVLAEQRDQSQNEDAAEFHGAVSVMAGNTSIGLGQVVVSTAMNADLFADLLSASVRRGLSHRQVAWLLTSDEFNIFAAARYIRRTADRAPTNPARLPRTMTQFPGTDLSKFSQHSRNWPADNIKVLGCEYTSTPWDDDLRGGGWGWFVHQCYTDIQTSGVTF
ncbi:hypothetical protein F1188_08490 [Roseospira marina]|uniref:Uncharacterized protein n=1 Tax=Roseospira marina TaxID=140057 RepID=A0A5M6ICN6_9PROT|nr:hypothetical protein [Roseospira marina]KAA5606040.1 hypothetical protein F1188_08490 [Roseospira marina]MBB4313099.1 hypothetical protein [Roseospira marina]MBB5086160.1 hypothetical protein [Roseospira marina]